MRQIVLVFLTLLAIVACNHVSAPLAENSDSISSSAAMEAPHFSDDSFAAATVEILDDETSLPIGGAKVRVVCLGGTPYQESNDTSNDNGLATVTYWNGNFVTANVEKAGYLAETHLVRRLNPIVRLKHEP